VKNRNNSSRPISGNPRSRSSSSSANTCVANATSPSAAQIRSSGGYSSHIRPIFGEYYGDPVLTRHWAKLGLTLDLTDLTDAQAVATVGRITRGNFRLVHRLFAQVARVMKINNLSVITSDVIETALGTLVIGEDAT